MSAHGRQGVLCTRVKAVNEATLRRSSAWTLPSARFGHRYRRRVPSPAGVGAARAPRCLPSAAVLLQQSAGLRAAPLLAHQLPPSCWSEYKHHERWCFTLTLPPMHSGRRSPRTVYTYLRLALALRLTTTEERPEEGRSKNTRLRGRLRPEKMKSNDSSSAIMDAILPPVAEPPQADRSSPMSASPKFCQQGDWQVPLDEERLTSMLHYYELIINYTISPHRGPVQLARQEALLPSPPRLAITRSSSASTHGRHPLQR